MRPGCATAIERDLKKWLSFKLLGSLVYNPSLKCAVAGQLGGDFHLRKLSVKRQLGGMEAWRGLLLTVLSVDNLNSLLSSFLRLSSVAICAASPQ